MYIERMQATRKRRRDVKVAPQAAPINENSQFAHGEQDAATRAKSTADSESATAASRPT